jgi:hypothetical protein
MKALKIFHRMENGSFLPDAIIRRDKEVVISTFHIKQRMAGVKLKTSARL